MLTWSIKNNNFLVSRPTLFASFVTVDTLGLRTIFFRKFVLNFYVHMYTREFVHTYSVWREWYDKSSPISLQEFKAWHQRKFYCFNNIVKVLSLQRATSVWDSTRVRVFQPGIKEENQWTFLAICFSIGLWFPFWTIFEVFLVFNC